MPSLPPTVRCSRIKKDGTQCKRRAKRGTNVCTTHGAQLPSVRKAAERNVEDWKNRVTGLVDPALDRLEELMMSGSDTVALGAVKEIMDRAGFVVVKKSEVKQVQGVDDALAALLQQRRMEQLSVGSDDVEDAEIVSE